MITMPITQQAYDRAGELRISIPRLQYLDRLQWQWIDEGRTPSIVARILRYGVEVFHGAYGVSSPGYARDSLRTDYIYPVSSLTKPITSALMFMLQEDGLIDLCDCAQAYLPEFIGKGKESVLLWHLLSHNSGVTDKSVIEYIQAETPEGETLSREDQFVLGMRSPLAYTPDTETKYCNIAYHYCAEIIKRTTGKTLDEIARERIFDPLGMDDSYWILPQDRWHRVIKRDPSYQDAKWYNSDDCLTSESGSGGMKTTATDITTFFEMIRQDGTYNGQRILSPASVREMTTTRHYGIKMAYKKVIMDSSRGIGFNIRGTKSDEKGMLRSSVALDHGGSGGVFAISDKQAGVTFAHFTVDIKETRPLSSRFVNAVYSALD
jgi:CubicO group peptidase (beta-lactamase class C family)